MTHHNVLSGRTAVVTGALGKLGAVWAGALLEAGAGVAGVDLKGAPVSPAFAVLQKKYGKRLSVQRADITRRKEIEKARAEILKTRGAVSILVNNAGIDQPPQIQKRSYDFAGIPAELVEKTFSVNFLGAFQMLQVFGQDLADSGHGSAINIGSLYARVSPDQRFYDHIDCKPAFLKPPAYGASKAALINLTRFLATLWAPKGIRVNALSPGGVLAGQDPQFKAKYCARVPMGRMASPGDLGGPLVFLASDASSYVTGIDLVVDGGFTCW